MIVGCNVKIIIILTDNDTGSCGFTLVGLGLPKHAAIFRIGNIGNCHNRRHNIFYNVGNIGYRRCRRNCGTVHTVIGRQCLCCFRCQIYTSLLADCIGHTAKGAACYQTKDKGYCNDLQQLIAKVALGKELFDLAIAISMMLLMTTCILSAIGIVIVGILVLISILLIAGPCTARIGLPVLLICCSIFSLIDVRVTIRINGTRLFSIIILRVLALCFLIELAHLYRLLSVPCLCHLV